MAMRSCSEGGISRFPAGATIYPFKRPSSRTSCGSRPPSSKETPASPNRSCFSAATTRLFCLFPPGSPRPLTGTLSGSESGPPSDIQRKPTAALTSRAREVYCSSSKSCKRWIASDPTASGGTHSVRCRLQPPLLLLLSAKTLSLRLITTQNTNNVTTFSP